MKQQTAVEWIVSQLHLVMTGDIEIDSLVKQAKEMERQQIIAARMDGMTDDILSYHTAEQYYNETYGGEK